MRCSLLSDSCRLLYMQNHQRSWLRHHIIKAHGHSPCCGVYQLRLDFSVRGGGGGARGKGGASPMLHVRKSSQKLSDVQHCSRVISGICSTNPADGALPEGAGSGLPSSSCPSCFWWGTFADLPCESSLLLVPFCVGVRGSCKQYFHLCLDSSGKSSDANRIAVNSITRSGPGCRFWHPRHSMLAACP